MIKQRDTPTQPKVVLAFIFILVCWILAQMGYSVVHQLEDIPPTAHGREFVYAVIRDISTNHILFERLFNGFIIYLLCVGIYHILLQFILRIKLNRYLSKRMDLIRTAEWKHRFRNEQVEVMVVKESAFVAMALGIWKPRIIISTGVLSRFDDEEIKAILLHELYHCKAYHPLQMSLLLFLSKGLAFVPLIKDLTHYYGIWTELLADRYAIRRMNSDVPIGRALLSLIKNNTRSPVEAGIPFANEAVNYRIKQIIDPTSEIKIAISNRRTVTISIVVLIVMSLFLISNCLN